MKCQYGICLNYQFTKRGQEAVRKGISWQKVLKPKYNGVYYWLRIETAEEKYEPLLQQMKEGLHNNQNFNQKGDLEDLDPQKKRLKDKKWHPRRHYVGRTY